MTMTNSILKGSLEKILFHTVDGSEILHQPTCRKPVVNNEIFTISTGEFTGFLNHQQYLIKCHPVSGGIKVDNFEGFPVNNKCMKFNGWCHSS